MPKNVFRPPIQQCSKIDFKIASWSNYFCIECLSHYVIPLLFPDVFVSICNKFLLAIFQALEDKERKHRLQLDQLNRQHRYLRRRLESLTQGQYRMRIERSISESSSCVSSSSSSSSATSEPSEAGKSIASVQAKLLTDFCSKLRENLLVNWFLLLSAGQTYNHN